MSNREYRALAIGAAVVWLAVLVMGVIEAVASVRMP